VRPHSLPSDGSHTPASQSNVNWQRASIMAMVRLRTLAQDRTKLDFRANDRRRQRRTAAGTAACRLCILPLTARRSDAPLSGRDLEGSVLCPSAPLSVLLYRDCSNTLCCLYEGCRTSSACLSSLGSLGHRTDVAWRRLCACFCFRTFACSLSSQTHSSTASYLTHLAP
jgi:hypothetical protein